MATARRTHASHAAHTSHAHSHGSNDHNKVKVTHIKPHVKKAANKVIKDTRSTAKKAVKESKATAKKAVRGTKIAAKKTVKNTKMLSHELYKKGIKTVAAGQDIAAEYSDDLLKKVKANPLASVLAAAGVGFVLSALILRK